MLISWFFLHCRFSIIAKDSSNTGSELKWLKVLFRMLSTLTEIVCKKLCVCVCHFDIDRNRHSLEEEAGKSVATVVVAVIVVKYLLVC